MQFCGRIEGLFTGRAKVLWEGRPPSGIAKERVNGPVNLTVFGIAGDEQADLSVHGGPEKAVHHYPADHYQYWTEEFGENDRFVPGGFGENISTFGMNEETVCIGDTMRVGTALLQISQGRQPCWKLAAHADVKRLPFLVQKTARTGWYYRVLQAGQISTGDPIELIARPRPEWTVREVTKCIFNGRIDKSLAAKLSEISELAPGWRNVLAERAGGSKADK